MERAALGAAHENHVFFILSKLLDVLLSPYTWGLALLVLAVPWRRPRRKSAWRRQRLAGLAGASLLFFFALEPVSNWILYRLEHATTSTYRPDVTYDAVILLGGVGDERVTAETGQPTYNDNVERLVATHRLLAAGHARFAIVSGAPEVAELAEYGEARVLGRQIVDWEWSRRGSFSRRRRGTRARTRCTRSASSRSAASRRCSS